MSKVAPVIAGVVAIGLAAWGGIELNKHLQCQGLEEDYLNAVSGAKQHILLGSLSPNDSELVAVAAELQEAKSQEAEDVLAQMYQQCGERAAQTALRKGSRILLGY